MNHDVVGDLDYVLVYLDDILVLVSNQDDSFEDHLAKIQEVFKRLHNVGLKVNLHKTELCQTTLDYLGYTSHLKVSNSMWTSLVPTIPKLTLYPKWAEVERGKGKRRCWIER